MMKLTKFEVTKIFQNRTVMGALVVSACLLFGIFFVGYHYSQENMAGRHNAQGGYSAKLDYLIQEKYTGDLTDEKVELIIADYIDFWQDEHGKTLPFYPFYWYVTSTFVPRKNYDIYLAMTDKLEKGERLSIEEVPLKKMGDKNFRSFDKPLQIGNYVPWTELYKVMGNIYILSSILVALACSLVFADDTSRNMNQILFTTKQGRSKLLSSKILAGLLFSSLLFIVLHLINVIIFALMHDSSGWKSSIQANLNLKVFDFPMEWNHLQVYLWVICLQFLGLLFTAAVSLLVSSFVKSSLSAFSAATGLYLLPALLLQTFKNSPLSTYLHLFPVNQSNVKNMLALLSGEKGFITSSFISNFLILVVFLLAGHVFMNFLAYHRMKDWKFG